MDTTVRGAAKANTAKKKKKKQPKDPNRIRILDFSGRVDVPMLAITLVLLVFGITMMFSAGHALSYQEYEDSYAFVTKQMIAAGVGLILMFVLSVFDYRLLRREFRLLGGKIKFTFANLALILTLAVTALVIPFGVRNTVNGPKRWLKIPLFGTFQPSDFLKFGLIIFMAYYIHKHAKELRLFKYGMLRPFILFAVVTVLMLAQPHMSCLLIMTLICGAMLYIGGINWKPIVFVGLAGVGVVLLVLSLIDFNYFWDRIKFTFDPLAETWDRTYQAYQAILAVGSGGFWGVGFGNSTQKYYYLPEAQNDFVYAVLCEEFGFIGGFLVILLFLIFVMRGFYIARKAEDRFGMMLATGITFQTGLQALLNIGVNVCCIPSTGISMPFFSYGGTALMVQLAEMGLLLSVSKRAKLN